MDNISIARSNIRYFLWKKEKRERSGWAETLAKLLGCGKPRAKELLFHGQLSADELERFIKVAELPNAETFQAPFFEEKPNILKENLQYLFESIKQKDLAQEIGVSKDTVSRWYRGDHNITPNNLDALRKYLRLSADVNLRKDAIFLSLTPFDDRSRREWLNQQINEIDSDLLRDLFPAFERLFRE